MAVMGAWQPPSVLQVTRPARLVTSYTHLTSCTPSARRVYSAMYTSKEGHTIYLLDFEAVALQNAQKTSSESLGLCLRMSLAPYQQFARSTSIHAVKYAKH